MKTDIRQKPALNDPVVVDGVKHRITSLGGAPRYQVYVRDRFTRHEVIVPSVDRLRWDAIAGVWRVAK